MNTFQRFDPLENSFAAAVPLFCPTTRTFYYLRSIRGDGDFYYSSRSHFYDKSVKTQRKEYANFVQKILIGEKDVFAQGMREEKTQRKEYANFVQKILIGEKDVVAQGMREGKTQRKEYANFVQKILIGEKDVVAGRGAGGRKGKGKGCGKSKLED